MYIIVDVYKRQAEYCVFCDKNPDCIKIIKSNVSKTKNEKKSRIIQVDYKRFIKHDCIMKFDVVFLYPPYNTGLSDKALNYLSPGEHLNEGCIVVLECEASEKKPETSGVLKLRRRYTLSGVSYLVYVKSDE